MTLPQINLPQATPQRTWDLYVPIVANGSTTRAFLTEVIEEPSYYNELCYRLLAAEPHETFYLHINTPGGIIDSTTMLIDAIRQSPAKVIAYLTGTVASAGTMITMVCDDIIVAPHTSFMIHNYSSGLRGKGHELKAQQAHTDEALNAAFSEFYAGFLTTKEMREVIDGKDLWMCASEVTDRWARKQGRLAAIVDDAEPTPTTTRKGRPRKA